MSQYRTLLREQAQLYEGSPTAHNYAIYPSPDRYRQNSIGLSFPLENDVQNYDQNLLLKAAVTKELQGNNYTLNSLNYIDSKIINNQDIWGEELNNASDSSSFSQAIICPTYLTQEPSNIDIPQKSLMSFGNITPISPNHNKLLANCNVVGSLPNNELSGSSNYMSDINSPSFKENIEVIQQQSNLINSIDTNMLSLISFTDLKSINNGKLNLVTNNAELMAANTLLGPKINSNKKPLLNDVSIISSNNYTQDSMLPSIAGTPDSTPKMTTAVYAQNIGKINNTFFSPVLSPAISQIYPSDALKSQEKSVSSYAKPVKYEKMKMRNNTVPLIKTSAINKKLNKISNYASIGNLKAMPPFSLNTDFLNKKNEDSLILDNMEIDRKDIMKEDKKQIIEKEEKEVIKPIENQINNLSNVDTSILNQAVGTKPLSIIPISTSTVDLSINEINLEDIKQIKQITENNEKKKEEIILKDEKVDNVTKNNGDNIDGLKLEMDKMEIEKPLDGKDKSKEEEIIVESTVGDKKITTSNKMKSEIVKEKKEAKSIKASKITLKKDESKKKDKKKKENNLSEITSKEKSKIKKDKVLDKDSTTTKKETDVLKKNTNSKDNESLSVNTSPKIKKKPRFSAKKAKNDPAALEEHILLKRKRNTEAARRSRQRKVQQMKNLEEAVARLTKELEQANEQLKASQEKYEKIVEELKISRETYENKIKLLEEQLNNSFSFGN